jgi:hypothetical protein
MEGQSFRFSEQEVDEETKSVKGFFAALRMTT